MSQKETVEVSATFGEFLLSLQKRPLCDPGHTRDMTPEQLAALHAFMHEFLAAYWRMRMVVPEDRALRLLDQRVIKAAREKVVR